MTWMSLINVQSRRRHLWGTYDCSYTKNIVTPRIHSTETIMAISVIEQNTLDGMYESIFVMYGMYEL